MSKSMECIEAAWRKQEHERLGQYFINRYTKSVSWSELFNADRVKAIVLIEKWLKDNQYQNIMPKQLWDLDV